MTNQWVNSYKRLVPGFEAPVRIAWNRAAPRCPRPRRRAPAACPATSCACPSTAPAARLPPASSTGRRTRPATPTSRSRPCSPPASRASRRSTRCRRAATPPTRRASRRADAARQPLRGAAGRRASELLRRCLGDHVFESLLDLEAHRVGALPLPHHGLRAQPLPADPVGAGARSREQGAGSRGREQGAGSSRDAVSSPPPALSCRRRRNPSFAPRTPTPFRGRERWQTSPSGPE